MRHQNFIDRDKLYGMLDNNAPTESQLNDILNKARKLKGLNLEDVAKLLCVEDEADIQKILDTAEYCKDEIYGRRLVLFAPIYTGNACVNNCVYCGFRRDNKALKRKILTLDEIETETLHLLRMGHKRALLICGESPRNDANYMVEAIRRCYAATDEKGSTIRRINVELAPMSVEDYAKLKVESREDRHLCLLPGDLRPHRVCQVPSCRHSQGRLSLSPHLYGSCPGGRNQRRGYRCPFRSCRLSL